MSKHPNQQSSKSPNQQSSKYSLTYTLDPIRLERFEAAVNHRQHALAGEWLMELLRLLRAGAEFKSPMARHSDEHLLRLYTRCAAAVSTLLADPAFALSEDGLAMLGTEHEALQALFEASAFDNTDHLVHSLSLTPEEYDFSKLRWPDSPQPFVKFLATYCLNSTTELDFEQLYRRAAQSMLPVYLGMLAHRVAVNPRAHERRERLLGLHGLFADAQLPDGLMSALADAYMYCSYGVRADKHATKQTFGKLLRGMVRQHSAELSPEEVAQRRAELRRSGRKPTLLMPLEWFSSYHAMYRCYAPSVRQLREHFRLVASCKPKDLDDGARELFDDFLWLSNDQVILSDLTRRIRELAPDAIYYPSVGMSLWWVALAQLRLAPVQLMTLGHPATSASPCMDYVIAEEGQADPECFSERVLQLPPNAIQFTDRPDQQAAAVAARQAGLRDQDAEELRVAVPSMAVKVTSPFLALLRRVQLRVEPQLRAAGRRVAFHFFPNVEGAIRQAFKRGVDRWLPGAVVVHHRAGYADYLKQIGSCHLHLSTFPFGGTNSLIDSMSLGVPIIAKWGREPHERFDGLMLRRVGQEELLAQDEAAYEDLAVDLLLNDARRRRLSEQLFACDVWREFLGPRTGAAEGAFGRAVRWAVDHHEEVQRSDERVVRRDW